MFSGICKRKRLPVKQGLHEILEFLKKSQIPMAVATSSSQEHALGNLEKEGLLGYFQAVITGNMVSRGKPWPEIYEKACRALDLPRNRCWPWRILTVGFGRLIPRA